MGNKIAISTNKGGVLKSSITVNLAGILSKEGYKVLIVDMDNQGNASLSFGMNPDDYKHTVYDVMLNNMDAKKVIHNVYENIDVLPANDEMVFFEFDVLPNLKKYKEPFHLLKNSIKHVEDDYDYILFDTPPNLGLTQGNVLSVADNVLIPFQPESYSMRSLVKILNAINQFKDDHNPSLNIIGVVGTLVDLRTSLHSEVLSECRKFCYEKRIHMLDTVVPRRIRYANSIAYQGLPATLTAGKNEVVQAYYDLYNEIKGDIEND